MAEIHLEVLVEATRSGETVTDVCLRRGISRETYYQYPRRYRCEGPDAAVFDGLHLFRYLTGSPFLEPFLDHCQVGVRDLVFTSTRPYSLEFTSRHDMGAAQGPQLRPSHPHLERVAPQLGDPEGSSHRCSQRHLLELIECPPNQVKKMVGLAHHPMIANGADHDDGICPCTPRRGVRTWAALVGALPRPPGESTRRDRRRTLIHRMPLGSGPQSPRWRPVGAAPVPTGGAASSLPPGLLAKQRPEPVTQPVNATLHLA